jgi:hemerythrin
MTLWTDSLLVGVPQIDDQHKKLISTIDDIIDACKRGEAHAGIGKTLDFLVSYTKEHFRDEETIHVQHNYPDLAAHKLLHEGFIKAISAFQKEFEETGANLALVTKINKVLVDWLVKHIMSEDKKFGDFVKGK